MMARQSARRRKQLQRAAWMRNNRELKVSIARDTARQSTRDEIRTEQQRLKDEAAKRRGA
jgi:hypothetical protein